MRTRSEIQGLTDVQGTGSDDSGDASSPQGGHTLLLDDSGEGINHVLVVSSLGGWECSVVLHSDECEIGWVTDDGPDEPGCERANSLLSEGERLALVLILEVKEDLVIDSQSCGGIEELAGQSGINSNRNRLS